MAQRLPRRICRECMVATPSSPEVLANIKEVLGSIKNLDIVAYLSQLAQQAGKEGAPDHLQQMKAPDTAPDGTPQIYLYHGNGCQRCNGTGYQGRIGIFEVMKIDHNINDMIMKKSTDRDMEQAAIDSGMITMIQDGYLKAIEGLTSIEEVLRVSKE